MNEREPVRRYSTGITLTGPPHRAVDPDHPRPGHGAVYIYCDRHGVWEANWADDYPEPDENGATYGIVYFEGDGTYEAAEAWARAQPAVGWYVAYPMCALPGTSPESLIGYQPLPPEEPN